MTATRLTVTIDTSSDENAAAIEVWLRDILDSHDGISSYGINANDILEEPPDPTNILKDMRDWVRELEAKRAYSGEQDRIAQLLITTDEWENGYFYSLGSVRGLTAGGDLWDVDLEMGNSEGELSEQVCGLGLGRDSALLVTLDPLSWDDMPDYQTCQRFAGEPVGTLAPDPAL